MDTRPRQFDIVVVANRLPVDRWEEEDGTVSWTTSPGGLVSALQPVMARAEGAWVGWVGSPGPAPEPFDVSGIHLVPVELSETDVQAYYEGFSNATIWPLYHDVITPPVYHRQDWAVYQEINERFADAAAQVVAPGGTVWVHDYQLQLVPALLRARRPDVRIGYFNHIPFPPYEIFAQLPWRRQVLAGLLGADLVGFQRSADASNFLRACRRALHLTTRAPAVSVTDPGTQTTRTVTVRAYPISIDAGVLDEIGRREETAAAVAQLRVELGGRTVVLGVDRLDYTKGIRHRLKAIEELYGDGTLDSDQVVFVQVAIPSRERVQAYVDLRDQIEMLVGRINGDHSSIGRQPIHYLHTSITRTDLVALYQVADVMLVTALRDGMNLVAKEYVAVHHDNRGVLVLSEFTGAAEQLRRAVMVNPHDIAGLKDAILQAVAMPAREQAWRMRSMRRQVLENDVDRWAATFLADLGGVGSTSSDPS